MKLSIVTLFASWCSLYTKAFKSIHPAKYSKTFSIVLQSKIGRLASTVNDDLMIYENPDRIDLRSLVKSWVFRNLKFSADVYFSRSDNVNDFISDIWKSALISTRVLSEDRKLNQYSNVFAFMNLNQDEKFFSSLQFILSETIQIMNETPLTEKDYFRRSGSLYKCELADQSLILFSLNCIRTKSMELNFAELDTIPEDFSNFTSNAVTSFPFKSVFDFISEINRPPDPNTMANLAFDFKIQDLKYDLKKLSKKKNPQEIVDGINCKLTRLKKWRDTLATSQPVENPNPFTDLQDWSDHVKAKYKSLKYLAANDPKRALETQYDVTATFTKIIDQWSDRLKRNFKYFYQSQKTGPSMTESTQVSIWNNEIKEVTSIYQKVIYLDFEQLVDFEPGDPELLDSSLMDESFVQAWSATQTPGVALKKLNGWLNKVDMVQSLIDANGLRRKMMLNDGSGVEGEGGMDTLGGLPSIHDIHQVTITRAYTLERIQKDFWKAISEWTDEMMKQSSTETIKKERRTGLIRSSSSVDHTDEFIDSLKRLNKFTRSECAKNSIGVKDFYTSCTNSSSNMLDWLSDTILELDLINDIQQRKAPRMITFRPDEPAPSQNPGVEPWSELIPYVLQNSDAYRSQINPTVTLMNEADPLFRKVYTQEKVLKEWSGFSETLENAEKIHRILPLPFSYRRGREEIEGKFGSPADQGEGDEEADRWVLKPLIPGYDMASYTVKEDGMETSSGNCMLFTLPRYFRNVAPEEELESFLVLCQMMDVQMKNIYKIDSSMRMKIIPLHPLLKNQKGISDKIRQSPYPTILVCMMK